MTDANVTEITKQLAALERSVRRCKAALVGFGIIVAAGAGLAFLRARKPPATVVAKEFLLVDASAKVRATLNVDSTGQVVLRLLGKSGNPLVSLGTMEPVRSFHGPGIGEISGREEVGSLMLVTRGERPSSSILAPGGLLVTNRKGLQAQLLAGEASARLVLGRTGGVGSAAGLFVSGQPKAADALTFWDWSGKPRLLLGTRDLDTSLNLYDEAGTLRASLDNDDIKSSETGLSEHRAESSLVLFKEDGKVAWKAP